MTDFDKPVSRSELARRLGVDRVTIWNWERGGKLPPPERVSGKLSLFGPAAQMAAADLAAGVRA